MSRRPLIVATAILVPATLASAAAAAPTPPVRPAGSTTIPAVVTAEKKTPIAMYVPVTIAGRKVLMTVDTGAQTTVLDRDVAKRLKLPKVGKPVKFSTIGCTTSAQPVKVGSWSVGGVALPASIATSQKFSGPKIKGVPVVGLLGADAFSALGVVSVDFVNAQLVVGGPFATTDRTFPVTTLRSKANGRATFMITKAMVGPRATTLAIDTGASTTALERRLAVGAHLHKAGKRVSVGAVSCRAKVQPVKVPAWSIGPIALPSSLAISNTTDLPKQTGGKVNGLLGANVLASYGQVTLDYVNLQAALGYPPVPQPAPVPEPQPAPAPTPTTPGPVVAPPAPVTGGNTPATPAP